MLPMNERIVYMVWDVNDGAAVPDGKVAKFVDDFLKGEGQVIFVGTDTIVSEFRLRVKRGEKLKLYFVAMDDWMSRDSDTDWEFYRITEKGRVKIWPETFGLMDRQLSELVHP